MKLRIFVPVLVFALFAPAFAAQAVNPAEEALNHAATDRMNYLESVYGIMFDRKELCNVSFGIPAGDNQSFLAEYVPDQGSVYLNAKTVMQFARAPFYFGEHAFEGSPRLNKNPSLVVLLDHELGHALADQVSRRIGNGIWPSHDKLRKSEWHVICGTRILSEGIAGFFGYSTTEFKRKKDGKSLPINSNVAYWNSDKATESFYAGGYWLVNPILRRFGEKGLVYLVTHPFNFPDGKVRAAAKKYQRDAFVELGKSAKALTPEEALNQAVTDRMNYLEHRYHVRFDRKLFKGATFGMPVWGLSDNLAEYDAIEGRLYVNPKFTLSFLEARAYSCGLAFRGAPRLNRNANLLRLLDHELGHVLADHISRRIGNGIWRDKRKYPGMPLDRINGSKILSEGIGEFYGLNPSEFDRAKGEKFLPVGYDENHFWSTDKGTECAYAGGYWLVRPILRKFREKGIAYIVTHPLDSPDGNLRQAAEEYQRKALVELGKKK